MSNTDTVTSGGLNVSAPTFVRDYAFKTLQDYFNPTEAVYIYGQGSTPGVVLTSSYGECSSPDGSEFGFLIPFFTSIVYDEYGELTPLGPSPQQLTRKWNTQPGNPLNIGQYAPDPYTLTIPQTNSYAGAGNSIGDYGTMAAHGKAAPGAPSKSVTSPRYATHIGDGFSYDPQYGNMGGAIANGTPIPAYTAVDLTKNPTPKLGAPLTIHLGKDKDAHGLEFWDNPDNKTTKALGVKLAAVSPGLEFDALDGGLKTRTVNGEVLRLQAGTNIEFGPPLPVDAPVISDSTFGGSSTPGTRGIAYVWIIPVDGGPSIDSALSPVSQATTTDELGQINCVIPAPTISTTATGLKVLAQKTGDPAGPFYLLFTVPTYDATAPYPFAVSSDDATLTTVQAEATPAISVTDAVVLVGDVPDGSHPHLARGTLALGSWASKEDVAGFTYEGGNSGAHLFVALDGAAPADIGIAYAKNASGGINAKSPWNLTVDWAAADVDGHHPLVSERMGGVMRADGGVQTITLDHSPPTDADIPWPVSFGPIRDGIVAMCNNDNSLWKRISGIWHPVAETKWGTVTDADGLLDIWIAASTTVPTDGTGDQTAHTTPGYTPTVYNTSALGLDGGAGHAAYVKHDQKSITQTADGKLRAHAIKVAHALPPTDADIPATAEDGALVDATTDDSLWMRSSGALHRVSIPAGGTTGQVLTKINATNYNADWETPSGGGGGGTTLVSISMGDIFFTASSGTHTPITWFDDDVVDHGGWLAAGTDQGSGTDAGQTIVFPVSGTFQISYAFESLNVAGTITTSGFFYVLWSKNGTTIFTQELYRGSLYDDTAGAGSLGRHNPTFTGFRILDVTAGDSFQFVLFPQGSPDFHINGGSIDIHKIA